MITRLIARLFGFVAEDLWLWTGDKPQGWGEGPYLIDWRVYVNAGGVVDPLWKPVRRWVRIESRN